MRDIGKINRNVNCVFVSLQCLSSKDLHRKYNAIKKNSVMKKRNVEISIKICVTIYML